MVLLLFATNKLDKLYRSQLDFSWTAQQKWSLHSNQVVQGVSEAELGQVMEDTYIFNKDQKENLLTHSGWLKRA